MNLSEDIVNCEHTNNDVSVWDLRNEGLVRGIVLSVRTTDHEVRMDVREAEDHREPGGCVCQLEK